MHLKSKTAIPFRSSFIAFLHIRILVGPPSIVTVSFTVTFRIFDSLEAEKRGSITMVSYHRSYYILSIHASTNVTMYMYVCTQSTSKCTRYWTSKYLVMQPSSFQLLHLPFDFSPLHSFLLQIWLRVCKRECILTYIYIYTGNWMNALNLSIVTINEVVCLWMEMRIKQMM